MRALKSTSHAIQRIIEAQGIHFFRIKALEGLPRSAKTEALVAKEMELIKGFGLEEEIEKSERLESFYSEALAQLDVLDRAILLDFYLKGDACYKVAMEYGFSEGGLRKRIDRTVKQIAEKI